MQCRTSQVLVTGSNHWPERWHWGSRPLWAASGFGGHRERRHSIVNIGLNGADFTDAPCVLVDPELFFPTYRTRAAYLPAKAVCAACPLTLRQPCLEREMAVEGGVKGDYRFGVRGGEDPDQRYNLHRARKARPCGTMSGWRRHRRRDEPVDQACQEARDVEIAARAHTVAA